MKISTVGIEFIKSFEGCRLYAYKVLPTERFYTIGWGHYGADVSPTMTITQYQADQLLYNDLQRYVQAVNNTKMKFIPTQNQFDALVSFCFNLGVGIMKDFEGLTAYEVSNEIPLYNKSGNQVLQGLVRRRKAEKELFDKDLYISREIITKEYNEKGTFYPNQTINIRNVPSTVDNDPVDTYILGEHVNYDKVVWTSKHIWISWVSEKHKVRRYMAIREVKNGIPQPMWGYIK